MWGNVIIFFVFYIIFPHNTCSSLMTLSWIKRVVNHCPSALSCNATRFDWNPSPPFTGHKQQTNIRVHVDGLLSYRYLLLGQSPHLVVMLQNCSAGRLMSNQVYYIE